VLSVAVSQINRRKTRQIVRNIFTFLRVYFADWKYPLNFRALQPLSLRVGLTNREKNFDPDCRIWRGSQ
jgi:hypothetical protein